MSRVIKFRVWDPHAKVFVKLDQLFIGLDGHLWQYVYGDPETISIEACSDRLLSEQFTDLLDRDGKEIYEGDLVSRPNADKSEWSRDSTDWGTALISMDAHGVHMYQVGHCGDEKYRFPWDDKESFMPLKEIVIVGNVHENPSLLKP